jgi:hypothetical protein
VLDFLDVPLHEVDNVYLVPVCDEPLSMDARPAANVEDAGRRSRQMAAQDLLSSQKLQLAQPGTHAVFLSDGLIVLCDRLGVFHPRNDM